MNTKLKAGLFAVSAATLATSIGAKADAVYLNDQPLATSVAPITRNGRTLVPMRDIFEALGATVSYDAALRSIKGTRGTTTVDLSIGNPVAFVNNQRVTLDAAPTVVNGSTLVPLRFVSEALGAQVRYDPSRFIAFVNTNGTMPGAVAQNPKTSSGTEVAGVRQISIPAGVVVPVTLDTALSSATAQRGNRFTATVVSERPGDSEFPAGTKLEGVVREATPKQGSNPGVLDLDFRAVVTPDGTRYPLGAQGAQLVDLNDQKIVDDNGRGRITAKSSGNDRLKVIGIGAGAGYLLGKVLLKKNGVLSAAIGGLAGYLFDAQRDKRGREASLEAGTKLGIRLDRPVTYADTNDYSEARQTFTTS